MSSGGTAANAWYAFEPVRPRPRKAPLAIVMHGYGEYSGYEQMYEFIRHTVRKGSVVIYPRWQTAIATPCPGPFDIEPCIRSANRGIRGALAHLRASPKRRVQPDLKRASYFGFSFGGVITANLANRHRRLNLPKPQGHLARGSARRRPERVRRAGGGRLAAGHSVDGEAPVPLER